MRDTFRAFEIAANPWQADEREVPHAHDWSEWNLIVRGQAERLVDGAVVSLGAGAVAHIPAGVEHSMIHSSTDLRFWVIWSHVSSEGLSAGASAFTNGPFMELVRLCRLVHQYREVPVLATTLAQSLQTLLEHHWSANGRVNPGAIMHPAVHEAVRLLHAHKGKIELQDLADRVGLSLSRLGHVFTEQVGVGLHAYRGRCLLQAFDTARLAHPDHDLASLAVASGFRNYMHCYRTHVRVRGVPPSTSA